MCGIFGWFGRIPALNRREILEAANSRGRDGWGAEVNGINIRSLRPMLSAERALFTGARRVIGNFRATPTTEAISKRSLLQPYNGIVHNGVIANDKEFGDYPIDSMVLGDLFSDKPMTFPEIQIILKRIKGSYALAYFSGNRLIMACNYKPIYYRRYEDGFAFVSVPISREWHKFPAYHIGIIREGGSLELQEIPRIQNKRVVISASSGLDSTTVAYLLKSEGYEVILAHFTYGCLAEEREMDRIKRIAEHGGFGLTFIELPRVSGGTLVSGGYHRNQIEGVEYAEDWISARNLMMLSILTAWAENNGCSFIAFGGNLEESGAYPDNEQEFGNQFNEILPYATQNGVKISLLQPLSHLMKHEIVALGTKIGVPWDLTWSCYSNGESHCGECAPCYMRRVAFERNHLKDPA